MEFFLVHISLFSEWIRRFTKYRKYGPKENPYFRIFHALVGSKIICILFQNLYRKVVYVGSFTSAKFFISLNASSTVTPIGNIDRLMTLIAIILRCLLIWKFLSVSDVIVFQRRAWPLHSELFRFLTVFKKKVFKSCAFFSIFCKDFIIFCGVNIIWRFCLLRKKVLIVFRDCYLQYVIRR